ncbi:MAG: outer membrane beta-barrel protein [Bacteroidales bacterium]
MTKSFFFCIIFVFSYFYNSAQINQMHVFAGINYGGPIPTNSIPNSSGKPIIGINSGLGYTFKISGKLAIISELFLSTKGTEYSQTYTRDTLVKINIMGVQGEVPSYYTAYVNGKMKFYYLDFALLMAYKTKFTSFLIGPYISGIISGKDVGSVRIMIGDGGFYDDFYQDFDNYSFIHKIDAGFIAGSLIPIYKKLSLTFKLSRSFISIYKDGFFISKGNSDNKLFNTYIYLSIAYKLGNI